MLSQIPQEHARTPESQRSAPALVAMLAIINGCAAHMRPGLQAWMDQASAFPICEETDIPAETTIVEHYPAQAVSAAGVSTNPLPPRSVVELYDMDHDGAPDCQTIQNFTMPTENGGMFPTGDMMTSIHYGITTIGPDQEPSEQRWVLDMTIDQGGGNHVYINVMAVDEDADGEADWLQATQRVSQLLAVDQEDCPGGDPRMLIEAFESGFIEKVFEEILPPDQGGPPILMYPEGQYIQM